MFGSSGIVPGNQPPPKPPSQALASTIGAVAVFFGAPMLERNTEEAMRDYAYDQWGDWTDALIGPLWWIACIALIFFAVRALTPRALKMFELKILRRLFP